jgi:hypothetical protein
MNQRYIGEQRQIPDEKTIAAMSSSSNDTPETSKTEPGMDNLMFQLAV